jgi:hypothetical protein
MKAVKKQPIIKPAGKKEGCWKKKMLASDAENVIYYKSRR